MVEITHITARLLARQLNFKHASVIGGDWLYSKVKFVVPLTLIIRVRLTWEGILREYMSET